MASAKNPFYPLAPGEHRDTPRKPVLTAGLIAMDHGAHNLECTIRDISANGARVSFPRNMPSPETMHLINMRERDVHEAIIAWRTDNEAGLTFRRGFALSEIADPSLNFLKRLWLDRATR